MGQQETWEIIKTRNYQDQVMKILNNNRQIMKQHENHEKHEYIMKKYENIKKHRNT